VILLSEGNRFLMFFGTECAHCHAMQPLLERLEIEEGIHVELLEVWHNEKNAQLMHKLADGKCGSVPFLFNEKNGKYICGPANYPQIKEWAVGD